VSAVNLSKSKQKPSCR